MAYRYYRFKLSDTNAIYLAVMCSIVTAGFVASYFESHIYHILIPLILFSVVFSIIRIKKRL